VAQFGDKPVLLELLEIMKFFQRVYIEYIVYRLYPSFNYVLNSFLVGSWEPSQKIDYYLRESKLLR